MVGTSIGLICLLICIVIGVGAGVVDRDVGIGLWIGGACAGVVLLVWFICALPYSNWQKDTCQNKAEGYGLEQSEWSFRYDCRVYLDTGQLVPESRIRITSDGQIVVTDD